MQPLGVSGFRVPLRLRPLLRSRLLPPLAQTYALHFALGHTDRPAEAEAVRLLGGTGAALMADENGMLVSS